MSHVDIGRRVTLYLNLCCWLVGLSVDKYVVSFMFGPLTVEVWR
jgi:hypothetical protein